MNANLLSFRCLKTAILALALVLPVSGWAQYNYFVNNGAANITAYTGSGGVVTIPGTLGGFPVKNIGSYAFNNTPFVNYSLTSVSFPNSVTNIDDHAFEYCYGLTNVTFGSGLVSMGLDAFLYCISLPRVSLPASATNLGPGVFGSCESLTNISLPSTLPRISPALLAGCSKLGTVAIPSSVTSIDEDAFSSCYNLTNIALPAGLTNIDTRAFQYCKSLKGLAIPQNVVTIGYGAFGSCDVLANISIPASVLNIGDQAFWFSTSLTNISVNPLNPNYSSVEGVLFDKAVTTLIQFPPGWTGRYAVPMGVTNIPEFGFFYCPYFTSVTLPTGLLAIRDNTFLYAAALTNVTIPNSVTSIGYSAFLGCSGLPSVTIPASVTNISQVAFQQCNALQQAYFLGNAPSVDGLAGSSDGSVFGGDNCTVFYPLGTTGWAASFGGRPTAPGAYHPQPQILRSGQGFGVTSNNFSSTISWAPNTPIVVEASTNLVNWTAIATNQSTSGTNAFGDASRTNYPHRFYRARSF